MRTGSLRTGAGLAVLLLLACTAVRAQTVPPGYGGPYSVPPAARVPSTPLPVPVPAATAATPLSLPTAAAPLSGPAAEKPRNGALGLPEAAPVAEKPEAHPVAEKLEAEPGGACANGHCGEHFGGEGTVGEAGFIVTGDYLLIHPRRQALDFAVLGFDRTALPGGRVESVDWDTQSGFRVGAAYRLPHDNITIGAEYTYLHTHGTRVLGLPDGGQLFATVARAGGVDDVTSAAATTNLDYNVLDVDVAKKICCGESLELRVFGGGRFAWIDQKFDVLYNGGSVGAVNYRVIDPVFFHGAGLTAGAEGTWRIYRGLGLYAKARGSLVSGEFRTEHIETNNNNAMVIVNLREKYYNVVPVMELGLGVSVEYNEHCFLKVGYELVNWFNMVHSIDLPDGTGIGRVSHRDSDLSLEGLRVQLGITF
jgi:hypothetical protein